MILSDPQKVLVVARYPLKHYNHKKIVNYLYNLHGIRDFN